MSTGLAKRLRDGTWPLHQEVERSSFMRTMLRGQLQLGAYCLLLRNLHPLYATLEAALTDHASHVILSGVHLPALYRARSIADDLATLHGPDWASSLDILPAARDYQARLADLHHSQPGLLVAHAYVRYLGDLSGGQQLRRIVARSLRLSGSAGTAFYDFGDVAQCAALAAALRNALDAIRIDASQVELTVDEARDAFARHGVLLAQLADAAGLPAAETLTNP